MAFRSYQNANGSPFCPLLVALLVFSGVKNAQPPLQNGDANMDLVIDQLHFVQVRQAGRYLTGQPATWGEGDWDGAPGGWPGNPPPGDGVFNQLDIIAANLGAPYLRASYAAILGGATSEPAAPEPSSVVLLVLGLLTIVLTDRGNTPSKLA